MPLQVTLGHLTLFPPLYMNMFSQSDYITTLLTLPYSYRLQSQFLPVILLTLIAICRQVTGSSGPSPVRVLCRRCFDVTVHVNECSYSNILISLKIAEFRTPVPQDVQKKGSKILKLPPVRNCFTLTMTNKLVVIINSLK